MNQSKPIIDRMVAPVVTDEVASMITMLFSLPRATVGIDAHVVFPGMGELCRETQAVSAWEKTTDARYFLVAGTNPSEDTQHRVTISELTRTSNLTKLSGVITQEVAAHTPSQAEWVVDKVQELGITSIGLHAPPYHLPRAYCTILKVFQKRGLSPIAIIPYPTRMAPGATVPEIGCSAEQMFYGEAQRIRLYQQKGDVSTLGELKDHIDWMWQQPILGK